MNAVGAEAILVRLRYELEAARTQWKQEFARASKTLRYEDLVAAARRMDEVLDHLVKVWGWSVAPGGDPGRQRRSDRLMMEATFAALSSSVEVLSRTRSLAQTGEGISVSQILPWRMPTSLR